MRQRISLTYPVERSIPWRIILWIKVNWWRFLFLAFVIVVLLCIIFCPGNAGAQWELTTNFTNSSGYYPGEGGCWEDCSGYLLTPADMTCAVFPEHGIKIWRRKLVWTKGDAHSHWEVTEQGDIIKVVLPDGREFVLIPTDVCGIPGRVDFLVRSDEEALDITFLDNSVLVYIWR